MANTGLTPEQQAEIMALRKDTYTTRRVTAPALEEVLYEAIPVLDHGFIRVVDYMGNDSAIVQAARVSYGRGTRRSRDDASLIRYLLRNAHTTPFEMCEIKFHVKMPIFVARQWIRHRTANVNEYSARYSVLDSEFYVPALEQLAAQSTNNRQGRGDVLSGKEAAHVLELLSADAKQAFAHYAEVLNEDNAGNPLDPERQGLARELARIGLPISTYTQLYWKIDLHNLLHFLRLRADNHAQWEIRAYAIALLDLVERWVPFTYAAFADYHLGGVHLSAQALEAVRRLVAGEQVDPVSLSISPREWRELKTTLGI